MALGTPESAIVSAIVFNALIIPALVPLALRGVAVQADRGHGAPAPQRAHLWRGRADRPVPRDQGDRLDRAQPPRGLAGAGCLGAGPLSGRSEWAPMAASGRGRYKVFLGMAAGVGKTYRMLQEGRAEAAVGSRRGHRLPRAPRPPGDQGSGGRARTVAATARSLPRSAARGDGPARDLPARTRAVPDRRACAHQRAGTGAPQALRGHRGRARGGHRRVLHRERAAPGEPQRPHLRSSPACACGRRSPIRCWPPPTRWC